MHFSPSSNALLTFPGQRLMSEPAFGTPGLPPTWASARKQAVGTALSDRSRVWFTVADPETSNDL